MFCKNWWLWESKQLKYTSCFWLQYRDFGGLSQFLKGFLTVFLKLLCVGSCIFLLLFLLTISLSLPTSGGIIFFSAYVVLDISLMDNLCQLLTQGFMWAFLCSQFEGGSLQKVWPLIPLHIFSITLDFKSPESRLTYVQLFAPTQVPSHQQSHLLSSGNLLTHMLLYWLEVLPVNSGCSVHERLPTRCIFSSKTQSDALIFWEES